MKIYTGRGDFGRTNLIGGKTVDKDHPRVQAYGSLDELNALIGCIKSELNREEKAEFQRISSELLTIQHHLYDIGTALADPDKKLANRLDRSTVKELEERIDYYDDQCPEITQFILAGGHPLSAMVQLARTVSRRCERQLVTVLKDEPIDSPGFSYVNRLSDYFFALGRYINIITHYPEVFYERGGDVFHPD